MEKQISDYRVKEQINGFVVQKKNVREYLNGYMPWSKWIKEVTWHDLDEQGKSCVAGMFNAPKEAMIYDTLEKAKQAIESFVKYPIYHYFIENDNDGLPIFPTDKPS